MDAPALAQAGQRRRGHDERGWLVRVAANVAPRGRATFISSTLVNGQWGESTTLLEVELTASASQHVQF